MSYIEVMLAELSPGASSASTVFGKSKKVTYLVLGEQSIADTSYQHHGNEKRDGGSDGHVGRSEPDGSRACRWYWWGS